MHYKEIVEKYNTISDVSFREYNGKYFLYVLGVIDGKFETLRVQYNHIEVALAVKTKVKMFIGV